MIITELKKQKKNDERFNLYLDGQYYCVLTAEAIILNRLKVGNAVTKEQIDELQMQTEKQTALNKTLKYLGGRLKTKKQVGDYLKSKGYVELIISNILNKLTEYAIVDDEHYTETFINCSTKIKGKRRIENELKIRGIDENLIKQKTAEIENEFENACELGKKYIKNKENNEKTRAGLYRFLIYRGFSNDDVMKVIKNLFRGEEYESRD